MSTHISGMPIKNSGGLNLLVGLKRKKKKKINMNYVLLVDLFPLLSGSLVRKIIPDLNNCGWIRIMVLKLPIGRNSKNTIRIRQNNTHKI
jgi:predicted DNA-binding ArsR family transcriptional regulator